MGEMNRGGHLDLNPKSRSGFKLHPDPDEKSGKVGIVSMLPDKIGPKAVGKVKENLDFS